MHARTLTIFRLYQLFNGIDLHRPDLGGVPALARADV